MIIITINYKSNKLCLRRRTKLLTECRHEELEGFLGFFFIRSHDFLFKYLSEVPLDVPLCHV